MIEEHDYPRAHVVADDFFSSRELAVVMREVRSLERQLAPGLVRDIGHDGQSVFFEHERRRNRAVWVHDPSKALTLFRDRLWSPSMVAILEQAREPLFQIIPGCSAPHLQVSSYLTGDHYDFHEDEGAGVNLTAIVFLAAEPKRVKGGDLVLAYDGEEGVVPFRHNRLVIFPSKTLHRVTPVHIEGNAPEHARISLQCWLTYGRDASAKTKMAKTKTSAASARAPEADRPTFLLAEPAILAAAQAMVGATGRPRTAEDVYWGAFYVSRILTANLQAVAASIEGLSLGPLRIENTEGALVVRGRGSHEGAKVDVGFSLRDADAPKGKALSLFVEGGRGAARRIASRVVPLGADEAKTASLLATLLRRR